MNTKLIALCFVFYIAHSLEGPVDVASGTSLTNTIEGFPEQRIASKGPLNASEKAVRHVVAITAAMSCV
ncbi:hypothetical protein GGP41_006988 [Bipolaris sorokiniana]|uniref:Uncharacterized protein n=1 Tax=Cochliobolus sativus TaxID=45130 RepID=A0A8H6E126_COCSA|nr:hypothetical protein GGP41_006988 [Bipolaris sorokiniana]